MPPPRRRMAGGGHAWAVPPGFNYEAPTCVNYALENGDAPPPPHTGKYAGIRATLDYTYHARYCEARAAWQDALVDEVLRDLVPQAHPWVVFSAGAMGAGKTHTIKWMTKHSLFPLRHVVRIDPDHFKERMPEWPEYCARDPTLAGRMCHRESGYIVELATLAALAAGVNVWVDGSLRDAAWYEPYFASLRAKYPLYRIAILHVIAPLAAILQRAARRGRATHRVVPEAEIKDSFARVPATVAALQRHCDFVAHISNEGCGRGPQLAAWSSAEDAHATCHTDGLWRAARVRLAGPRRARL
eukprot:TRINITY_DN20257_c0_g1_i1.p1 TRINITY_DN20257_c0_g1~~TRINITY_DN20257_c0_g1_i1.p1  ORF type:complete len:300 (+),score=98.48 TRINITY_DN20257_c0_g1_i1:60-959(+)